MTSSTNKAFKVGQRSDSMQALIIQSVKTQLSVDKQTGDVSNKLLVCARVYQKHDTIGKESESALRKDVIKARGKKKDVKPVSSQIGELKKSLESMPEQQALDLLKQLDLLVASTLATLVPITPVKVSTMTNPRDMGSMTDLEQQLDIDTVLATVIIEAGFSSLDDIIESGELLSELDDIDEDLANELIDRAVTAQLTNEFKEVA